MRGPMELVGGKRKGMKFTIYEIITEKKHFDDEWNEVVNKEHAKHQLFRYQSKSS